MVVKEAASVEVGAAACKWVLEMRDGEGSASMSIPAASGCAELKEASKRDPTSVRTAAPTPMQCTWPH